MKSEKRKMTDKKTNRLKNWSKKFMGNVRKRSRNKAEEIEISRNKAEDQKVINMKCWLIKRKLRKRENKDGG